MVAAVFLLSATVVAAKSGWTVVRSWFGVLERDGVRYEVELVPIGPGPHDPPQDGDTMRLQDGSGRIFEARPLKQSPPIFPGRRRVSRMKCFLTRARWTRADSRMPHRSVTSALLAMTLLPSAGVAAATGQEVAACDPSAIDWVFPGHLQDALERCATEGATAADQGECRSASTSWAFAARPREPGDRVPNPCEQVRSQNPV